ncbi:MAG: hypothetical protein AB7O66_20325 [Limisphaerales bacterium]
MTREDNRQLVKALAGWAAHETRNRNACPVLSVNWHACQSARNAFILAARIAARPLKKRP